jgi:chemotaxis protein MotB
MQRGNGVVRWPIRLAGRAVVVMGLVAVAAASVGCQQTQLEERNAALQKQLEQALAQNADLQAQNDGLKTQNQSLTAELDKARAAKTGAAATTPPGRTGRAKPEFGEGIETSQLAGGELTVMLPEAILFAPGKADLKADARRHLDRIIAVLNKDYAGDKIRVEGHTDSQPIAKSKKYWQDNWDLACNRAMSVVRYMTSKGIDPKRCYAAGFGPYKPVASNDTVAGRAKNRRVVIVVYPQHAGT